MQPQKNFNHRNDMIGHYLKPGMIGCELGVFRGSFSDVILSTSPSILYLVDIFFGIHGSGDENGENVVWIDMAESKMVLEKKYLNDERIRIIQSRSDEFLKSLNDDCLDFCYIDADHSYEAVSKDLHLGLMKVKHGGFIMGHDYTPKIPGVIEAVDEFCAKHELSIDSLSNCGCPSFCIKVKKLTRSH